MRYITALLALVGFLLLLGAAGDSDRGAGTHIQERAAAGVVLLAAGTFKLTVRLPDALATGLRERLRRKGYESITAYIVDCIEQLPPEEPEA